MTISGKYQDSAVLSYDDLSLNVEHNGQYGFLWTTKSRTNNITCDYLVQI